MRKLARQSQPLRSGGPDGSSDPDREPGDRALAREEL